VCASETATEFEVGIWNCNWIGLGWGTGLPKRILLIWISRDLYEKFYTKRETTTMSKTRTRTKTQYTGLRSQNSRVGTLYFYLCLRRCQSCLPKGLSCSTVWVCVCVWHTLNTTRATHSVDCGGVAIGSCLCGNLKVIWLNVYWRFELATEPHTNTQTHTWFTCCQDTT